MDNKQENNISMEFAKILEEFNNPIEIGKRKLKKIREEIIKDKDYII